MVQVVVSSMPVAESRQKTTKYEQFNKVFSECTFTKDRLYMSTCVFATNISVYVSEEEKIEATTVVYNNVLSNNLKSLLYINYITLIRH